MPKTMFEVHGEANGKRGTLTFEVEGNTEEVEEVFQAADFAITQKSARAGKTPEVFANDVLADVALAANRKDDPDLRRLIELAALYVVMKSPKRLSARTIRNCSVWMRGKKPDVYIWYTDEGPQGHTANADDATAPLTARKAMVVAKLTGVFPKGVSGFEPVPGVEAPVETKEFPNEEAAKAWLLGDGLHNFKWPIYSVEILTGEGKQLWRAYHSSNDVLKNKNEIWWYKADPGRAERQRAASERKRAITEGRIPREQLSLKEQFELDNPLWYGPFFAWLPTRTSDRGIIWLRRYWVRHTGLRYAERIWFFDTG